MRVKTVVALSLLLSGCAQTQVIDSVWDDHSISRINARDSGSFASATVNRQILEVPSCSTSQCYSLAPSEDRSHFASGDSLFVRSSTVLVADPPSTEAGEVSSIPDSRFYWLSVPGRDVSEITFRKRDRGRGFKMGMVSGALIAGLTSAIAALESEAVCGYEQLDECGTGDRIGGAAVVFAVGGLVGGLVGGAIGAAMGTQEIIIYRFGGSAEIATNPSGLSLRVGFGR